MAKILPSQVADQVETAFPRMRIRPAPGYGIDQLQALSSIMALYDRVPSEHMSLLSAKDYSGLLAAEGALRAVMAMWLNNSGEERRLKGDPPLRDLPDGSYPLVTFCDVLRKCPDTAPAASVGSFTFLGDPDLAIVIRQDITTAYSTLANHEFKAASVMAGSVVEALLLWAVERREAAVAGTITKAIAAAKATGKSVPAGGSAAHEWGLQHLLSVTNHIPVISDETFKAADQCREFRNLIHPGRAKRLQVSPTRARAMIAVGAMQQVVDDLEARVTAGTL